MADLRLSGGDLYLDSDGRVEILTGVPAVQQNWTVIIQTFLADWFRDRRVGVDYYTLFEKPANLQQFRAVMVEATQLVAGVQSVVAMEVLLDRKTREFSVIGEVKLQDGSLANLSYSPPILEQET